ncbi:MAG: DUF1801 domain-containing protein [Nitratireductor sp.]
MTPFKDKSIEELYMAYAPDQRKALLEFRELIFQAANENNRVGKIEEALKWGQASFLTKTGSTIRIDKIKDSQDVAMYFICTTHLVDSFREIYPDTFNYVKGRSLYFAINQPYDQDALKHCITMALTHKLKS